jgi:acetyl-CoA acyltransferase 1
VLSKLKPAFKKDGSTTAGNSSQVTDGAAAVLLARRSVAQALNLPILAKFVNYTVAGVPPEIMGNQIIKIHLLIHISKIKKGIGPAAAIPAVLKKTGLKQE